MGSVDAGVVLLTCGDGSAGGVTGPPPPGELHRVAVPARPGRNDVDPLLADAALRRLVVAGTDADLAAVLVRLLRRERLDVELAYLPVDARSAAARLWGLPRGRGSGAAALDLARRGTARPAPLVRDDAGGVLVGRAELRGAGGGALRGESYCDGDLVLRGSARRLVVTPWPDAPALTADADPTAAPAPPAVAVRAGLTAAPPDGRARPVPPRARTGTGSGVGRAVQVGCLPATVTTDGVTRPQPVTRYAWYRHVADWRLVRP